MTSTAPPNEFTISSLSPSLSESDCIDDGTALAEIRRSDTSEVPKVACDWNKARTCDCSEAIMRTASLVRADIDACSKKTIPPITKPSAITVNRTASISVAPRSANACLSSAEARWPSMVNGNLLMFFNASKPKCGCRPFRRSSTNRIGQFHETGVISLKRYAFIFVENRI